ncbi:hypothetical protein DFH06DRAFT_253745 [Mycena polygramma]|nr:hypothetical protein DFH06DRAFT_1477874 [Mycena polygramma]KAJ7666960.1 hypothetical protein DFH06DRAFT_253745 [Mycena polygramma]
MSYSFPSRAKKRKKASALPDCLWTALHALKESSDAFPPLKSAAGGVVAIWEIAERAKHSKENAREIALRAKEILDVVADAVPDPSVMSSATIKAIKNFTILLDEIRRDMAEITREQTFARIVHLRRTERRLDAIKARLSDAYTDFRTGSALRVEVQQKDTKITLDSLETNVKDIDTTLLSLTGHVAEVALTIKSTQHTVKVLSVTVFLA